VINLLPTDLKQSYHYAWLNRRLLMWSGAFLAGIAGIAIITIGGLATMNSSIAKYDSKIAATKATLASQDVAAVERQISATSGNLKLMVQVLSKQVLFSKLLARLGSATPSEAILTNLAISQTESAIDITAQTRNYNAATQLQVNLADQSNQIFSKADIVSITCTTDAAQTVAAQYPCTTTIRALFTKDNPFLFISNNTNAKAKP
jgi:Tfp pilus assembly protein PilN